MSKKQNTTREQVREKNEAIRTDRNRKIGKVAIFSGIAIVLATAIVLSTTYIIIPLIRGEYKSEYEFAYYRGTRVPKIFVEVLERADVQKKSVCETYGVAIEFNGHSISGPELGMVYYDVYVKNFKEEKTHIATYGTPLSDFPTREMPETVLHSEGRTWEQEILSQAQDEVRRYYYFFDEALKNNFVLTDEQIANIFYAYDSTLSSAPDTAAQLIASCYPAGITYDICASATIMKGYALYYSNMLKDEISEDISDKEADKWLADRDIDNRVFIGRIAPLEKDDEGWKSIKSSDEFRDYILEMYGDDSVDFFSDFRYATHGDIGSTFGNDVADFAFSDDRKAGEIVKFKAHNSDFILFCEKPAHYENSVDVFVMSRNINGLTEETLEKDKDYCQGVYDKWVDRGERYQDLVDSSHSFQSAFTQYGYGEFAARVGDYPLEITQWIFDENRKTGDHKIFMNDQICIIVYYRGDNPEDSDKDFYGRLKMVDEKYEEKYGDLNEVCPITVHKETTELAPSLVDFSVKELVGIRE